MGNKDFLWITSDVPKGAKILVLDMQEAFIINLDIETKLKQQLLKRVYDMKATLLDLKAKGHEIYMTVDAEFDGGRIHPVLEGISDMYVSAWANHNNGFVPDYTSADPINQYELHPDLIKTFNTESEVIVCGLWRETTLSVITRLLNHEGIDAKLSIDPALSIERLEQMEKAAAV